MEAHLPTGLTDGQLTALGAAVLDRAGDLIGFLGSDGAVLCANRAACSELQVPAELAVRATIFDFLPSLTPELWLECWQEIRADGLLHVVDRLGRRDGTTFLADVQASLVSLDGVELALVVARDVSEARRVEEALRKSAASFRALTENNPALITR